MRDRNLRLVMIASLAFSLTLWTGGPAFAADGDGTAAVTQQPTEALSPEDLDAALADLQSQGLSEEEARQVLGEATKQVMAGETSREFAAAGGASPEQTGPMPAGGYPGQTTAGGTGEVPIGDPRGQELMGQVNALEQEMQQKGATPEQIHEAIESQFGEKFREMTSEQGFAGREGGGYPEGGSTEQLRELYQEGRPVGEALEHHQGTESYGRDSQEGIQREMTDRPAYEAPTMERSFEMERSYEAPTTERSFEVEHSYEAPEVEHSYEAPTTEHSYEHETTQGDGSGMQY